MSAGDRNAQSTGSQQIQVTAATQSVETAALTDTTCPDAVRSIQGPSRTRKHQNLISEIFRVLTYYHVNCRGLAYFPS